MDERFHLIAQKKSNIDLSLRIKIPLFNPFVKFLIVFSRTLEQLNFY